MGTDEKVAVWARSADEHMRDEDKAEPCRIGAVGSLCGSGTKCVRVSGDGLMSVSGQGSCNFCDPGPSQLIFGLGFSFIE